MVAILVTANHRIEPTAADEPVVIPWHGLAAAFLQPR